MKQRIVEFRRLRASEIEPHPLNWRRHGGQQAAALRAAVAEIGWADAVIVYRRPGAGFRLIDGHLRRESVEPGEELPAIVLDVNDDEALRLLEAMDPIGAMAAVDGEAARALAETIRFATEELASLANRIAGPAPLADADLPTGEVAKAPPMGRVHVLTLLFDASAWPQIEARMRAAREQMLAQDNAGLIKGLLADHESRRAVA